MHAYAPVEKYEADFEYNPDGGLPDPAGFWSAAWQPNCGNDKVFDLSPYCPSLGTWAGSTTQRNVVTDRGRAWTFNSTDDLADFGVLDKWNPATLTAALRFRFNATPGNYEGLFGNATDGPALNKGWGFMWASDVLSFHIEAYTNNADTPLLNTDRAWHLVVGVYDGANVAISLDGESLIVGDAIVGYTTSTASLKIGTTKYFSPIDVQSAAFWHGCLSASQIRLLYESSLDGSPGVQARPIQPRWFPSAVAPPAGAIMDLIQKANLGADLYDGALIA